MGAHRGWRIRRRGRSYQGEAWDPRAQRYSTRSFETSGEAKAWGQAQHARYVGQTDAIRLCRTERAVTAYVEHLTLAGRVATHIQDASACLATLVAHIPDLSATQAKIHADAWWRAIAPHRAAATRNKYLRHARAMARWLIGQDQLMASPFAGITQAKGDAALRPQFTLDELARIASAWGDPYHLRACVQLYAGLRSDHAHRLEWPDFDWTGRVVLVRLDKGRKDRLVPLQEELMAVLDTVPHSERQGLLFPGYADLWAAQYGRHFRRFLRRLGIPKAGRSPHSLRHAYGAMMTATGVPLNGLQLYLGHSSPKTTSDYTKSSTRYVFIAQGWGMGRMRLWEVPGAFCDWPMAGWCSAWPSFRSCSASSYGCDHKEDR